MTAIQVVGACCVGASILLITANVAILLYHSVAGTDFDGGIHFGAMYISALMGGIGLAALCG